MITFDGRERTASPEIDSLNILDATEAIATFCHDKPYEVDKQYAARRIGQELVAAVGFKLAPGIEEDDEVWIERVRLAPSVRHPFDSASGLEIVLPSMLYNSFDGHESSDNRAYFDEHRSGIFASYPFDGMGWHGRPIGIVDFSFDQTTVAEVDTVIRCGRPSSGDEWVGFYLTDALAKI
jgi:hypothetical protein